jgi:hypothetical protein
MNTFKTNFIASVKDDRIADIKSIANDLKQLGCEITNILSFSGIITGEVLPNLSLTDLKIDGIETVELDRTINAA